VTVVEIKKGNEKLRNREDRRLWGGVKRYDKKKEKRFLLPLQRSKKDLEGDCSSRGSEKKRRNQLSGRGTWGVQRAQRKKAGDGSSRKTTQHLFVVRANRTPKKEKHGPADRKESRQCAKRVSKRLEESTYLQKIDWPKIEICPRRKEGTGELRE